MKQGKMASKAKLNNEKRKHKHTRRLKAEICMEMRPKKSAKEQAQAQHEKWRELQIERKEK